MKGAYDYPEANTTEDRTHPFAHQVSVKKLMWSKKKKKSADSYHKQNECTLGQVSSAGVS